MKDIILSDDELGESILKYRQACDCIASAIEKIKVLKAVSCEDVFESLVSVESALERQLNELEQLCSVLIKVQQNYRQTEQDSLLDVRRMIFSLDNKEKHGNVIVENNLERLESMLVSNKSVTHESWFDEIIMKDIYGSIR